MNGDASQTVLIQDQLSALFVKPLERQLLFPVLFSACQKSDGASPSIPQSLLTGFFVATESPSSRKTSVDRAGNKGSLCKALAGYQTACLCMHM